MVFANMSHYSQKHLLGIHSLSREDINAIFQSAAFFSECGINSSQKFSYLHGKTVVLGFFESSTRTRCSFEVAAKRLGAEVLLFQPQGSSVEKGETLLDTLETIDAMGVDIWVIRHSINGSVELMSNHSNGIFINAGEGNKEHPTQALLDGFTLLEKFDSLEGKRICIVGDILHSRVARSDIYLFQKLGAEVAICGPDIFMPDLREFSNIHRLETIEDSVAWADAINMLRIQKERIVDKNIPTTEEYSQQFGLRMKHLVSKPDIIVMHPGPANYGVEIDHEVAHSPQSVIQRQVRNGVAVRMAVLTLLSNHNR